MNQSILDQYTERGSIPDTGICYFDFDMRCEPDFAKFCHELDSYGFRGDTSSADPQSHHVGVGHVAGIDTAFAVSAFETESDEEAGIRKEAMLDDEGLEYGIRYIFSPESEKPDFIRSIFSTEEVKIDIVYGKQIAMEDGSYVSAGDLLIVESNGIDGEPVRQSLLVDGNGEVRADQFIYKDQLLVFKDDHFPFMDRVDNQKGRFSDEAYQAYRDTAASKIDAYWDEYQIDAKTYFCDVTKVDFDSIDSHDWTLNDFISLEISAYGGSVTEVTYDSIESAIMDNNIFSAEDKQELLEKYRSLTESQENGAESSSASGTGTKTEKEEFSFGKEIERESRRNISGSMSKLNRHVDKVELAHSYPANVRQEKLERLETIKAEIEGHAAKMESYNKFPPRYMHRNTFYQFEKLRMDYACYRYRMADGKIGEGCFVEKAAGKVDLFLDVHEFFNSNLPETLLLGVLYGLGDLTDKVTDLRLDAAEFLRDLFDSFKEEKTDRGADRNEDQSDNSSETGKADDTDIAVASAQTDETEADPDEETEQTDLTEEEQEPEVDIADNEPQDMEQPSEEDTADDESHDMEHEPDETESSEDHSSDTSDDTAEEEDASEDSDDNAENHDSDMSDEDNDVSDNTDVPTDTDEAQEPEEPAAFNDDADSSENTEVETEQPESEIAGDPASPEKSSKDVPGVEEFMDPSEGVTRTDEKEEVSPKEELAEAMKSYLESDNEASDKEQLADAINDAVDSADVTDADIVDAFTESVVFFSDEGSENNSVAEKVGTLMSETASALGGYEDLITLNASLIESGMDMETSEAYLDTAYEISASMDAVDNGIGTDGIVMYDTEGNAVDYGTGEPFVPDTELDGIEKTADGFVNDVEANPLDTGYDMAEDSADNEGWLQDLVDSLPSEVSVPAFCEDLTAAINENGSDADSDSLMGAVNSFFEDHSEFFNESTGMYELGEDTKDELNQYLQDAMDMAAPDTDNGADAGSDYNDQFFDQIPETVEYTYDGE